MMIKWFNKLNIGQKRIAISTLFITLIVTSASILGGLNGGLISVIIFSLIGLLVTLVHWIES